VAFALAAAAGVIAGLSINVFSLSAFAAAFFLAVLLTALNSGAIVALSTAAAAIGVLQVGYVAGLWARAVRSTPRNLEGSPSSEPADW